MVWCFGGGFFGSFLGFVCFFKAATIIILEAKNTAYERCSFLRINPTDVNEAILGKHGMSVAARGLLLSTDFLAGIRLWVAAVCLLFKDAFPISCLCKGAMFSTEQAFMNASCQEESSSKVVRGESLALCNGVCYLDMTDAASSEVSTDKMKNTVPCLKYELCSRGVQNSFLAV